MNRNGVSILVLEMCVPLIGSTGCGRDTVVTTGTNSMAVEVSFSIEGLNEFGDKRYGQCTATITR